MSVRGVISGVAGSAAVAVVAALSLGMAHAATDAKKPQAAHPQGTPTASPLLKATDGPAALQPSWLRRLLQRTDPAIEPAPMEAKRRRS